MWHIRLAAGFRSLVSNAHPLALRRVVDAFVDSSELRSAFEPQKRTGRSQPEREITTLRRRPGPGRFAMVVLAASMLAPAAGEASPELEMPPFDSLQLQGGGLIILRHGPNQKLHLKKGSLDITPVRQGVLVIDACKPSCAQGQGLVLEVVTPRLRSLGVIGGGRIEAQGAFPKQDRIGASVAGGGVLDARSLPAREVSASIKNGGSVLVRAESVLDARIVGGGEIRFWGDPSIVNRSTDGSGTVQRAGD